MAFGAKKIFPIDTKPSVAVGVSLPFNGNAVFNSTYTTQNAIKNNLINYFLTNQDERYLNPNYGGGLRTFIFENINSITNEDILTSVRFQIGQFFPNVSILDLNIKNENSDIDANQIVVSITYEIINTGITDSIQINFG
jgi:phage baseplate assembly protein W